MRCFSRAEFPEIHEVTYTDHQPLQGTLGSIKPVLQVLSPRMARCFVRTSAYDSELKYLPGKNHQNAGTLSRLLLPEETEEPSPQRNVLLFNTFPGPPLTAPTIAQMARKDPVLSRLWSILQSYPRRGLPQVIRATCL